MEVVGELLLSAAFQVLFDKLASSDFLTFARQEHIHSQLKKWETQLFNIREVLNDAEDKQIASSSVKLWLADLRILAYDMEDILDDSKVWTQLGLEKVAGTTTTTWKRTPTTSLFNEPQVHGRDDDKNKIVDLLLSDESAVVPIVGMGGLGKTTLTRLAYNDDAAILSDISPQSSDFNNFNRLQVELSQSLAGKRFLLVLDDVWNMNYEDWNNLRSPFRGGAKGSKVIVTTRDRGVALIMQPSDNYHHSLEPLSDDDCWSIFIVEKCRGLPLAAKVLGGILRSKQRDNEWEHILNSKIWTLPDTECGIIPALRLSYHHLPAQLKRCFVYCATFPQDYEFRETELVLLWMAEGLIQPLEGNKQMEDLGGEYFRELVSRSFFQQSGNGGSRFVMHDLISDLAQSVAGELSLEEVEKLRTFIVLPIYHGWGYLTSKVFNLKHLRYLNLSRTAIERLPESISELYNLQSLILCQCQYLAMLPKSIGNLVDLRHLDITYTMSLKKMPPHLGNLVNLQTLSKFIVEKNNSSSSIKELKKLPNIRGTLSILGLHNVADAQDAMDVDLKGKHNIKDLTMEWGNDFDDTRNEQNEMQVLELLQPHKNLEKLTISFYGGGIFPSWMRNPSFSLMVQLCLEGCRNCTLLPSLGQLSSLKNLRIEGMSGIKNIDVEFYGQNVESFQSLESLTFSDMPEWEEWRSPSFIDEERLFPRLRKLTMTGMFEVDSSASKSEMVEIRKARRAEAFKGAWILRSATELVIGKCPSLLFFPKGELPTSLKQLIIEDCENVKSLPEGIMGNCNLEQLNICGCSSLTSFPSGELPSTLKHLVISNCGNLELLPDHMPNLTYLEIKGCKGLKHHHLQNLTSLECLYIIGCPIIESLPEGGLPATLGWLQIRGCPIIEKRCLKGRGEDWPRIAHIPDIHIGGN
ncbi:unnamed protein product, partial [Vitis vinifera]